MLQEEAIKQVELRRRMRATAVPVIDADVRATLRQLGEPVTLFGEQQVQPTSYHCSPLTVTPPWNIATSGPRRMIALHSVARQPRTSSGAATPVCPASL